MRDASSLVADHAWRTYLETRLAARIHALRTIDKHICLTNLFRVTSRIARASSLICKGRILLQRPKENYLGLFFFVLCPLRRPLSCHTLFGFDYM